MLGSRRTLVVTDVDSTLIQEEVIELLAAHAGREAEVAAVTERAMRGELDFAASLHHRVQALKGLPVRVIAEVAEQVTPMPGALDLIAAAHANGHRVGAVSGGFIQVLEPLAQALGLDHAQANELGVRDGVLTGTVEGPVVDRAAKAAALRRWCAADDIKATHTVALGDGANDLDLLTIAGYAVGVRPKPALRNACDGVLGVRRLDTVSAALGWS
ncbi:phosphoserine phosphatase SerB [Galactobacter caseinivorans]|uniref:phosphoserine phosphatase n=2 Tax=Galactobacter caseinivorans TaxID=2676123 RepID=A0A496PL75_9MICC|nr:phosphoserine phosphatase SerB [Galactobacter caseinivorans]